jgi:hypothetical protein
MKDDILAILEGTEPLDALNTLFAAIYAVAAENGISEFNLSSLFSSNIEIMFEMASHEEEEEEEEEVDEQTED